jgi:hypothetical protein
MNRQRNDGWFNVGSSTRSLIFWEPWFPQLSISGHPVDGVLVPCGPNLATNGKATPTWNLHWKGNNNRVFHKVLKTHHRKAAFALNPANNAIHMIKTSRVPPMVWKTRFKKIKNWHKWRNSLPRKRNHKVPKTGFCITTPIVNPYTCEACYCVPLLISHHNLVLCFYKQASCCGTSFQAFALGIFFYKVPFSSKFVTNYWIKLFVKFVNTRKCGAGLGVECSECKCLELSK